MNEEFLRDSLQRMEAKLDQLHAGLGALSGSYARQDERLLNLAKDQAKLEKRVGDLEHRTDKRMDQVEKNVLVLTWKQKVIIAALALGGGAAGNIATELLGRVMGG